MDEVVEEDMDEPDINYWRMKCEALELHLTDARKKLESAEREVNRLDDVAYGLATARESLRERIRVAEFKVEELKKAWYVCHTQCGDTFHKAHCPFETVAINPIAEKREYEHDFQVPFDGVEVKLYEVCQKCGDRRWPGRKQ